MTHLSLETLARLVDEGPSPAEEEHLRACPACREELEGLADQTEALGSLPDLLPPRGDWEVLEARLMAEGLVRRGPARLGAALLGSGWAQVAAALILFFGGAGLGAAMDADGDAASGTATLAVVESARTPGEAANAVRQAEEVYVRALSRYRELSETYGPGPSSDPGERYVALEGILAASRAAIREAPADPFINGILVSTLAERQAALRQISSTDGDDWF